MPETIPQTASALKAYFTTGSFPTQTQFDELIDNIFYYDQQAQTTANAAVAAANAILGAKVLLLATSSGGSWSIVRGSNVASISGALSPTITFTTPLTNNNYVPVVQSDCYNVVSGLPTANMPIVTAHNAGSLSFSWVPALTSLPNGRFLYVAIFPIP